MQTNRQTAKLNARDKTINHLRDVVIAKQNLIQEFENVLKVGIKKTMNDSAKRIPSNLNGTSGLIFIREEVRSYLNSVRSNPVFTEVLTDSEIEYSIEKTYKQVMNEVSSSLR